MLVIASLSPVFIVWAVLGNPKIPDNYFIPACSLFVTVPHLIILYRIKAAKRQNNFVTKKVYNSKDSKEQLLTYFLPLVLPLMAVSFQSWRAFSATIVVFIIMAFASWHLEIYYLNIFFAIFGYRIYQINSDGTQPSTQVLITKRSYIPDDETIHALHLGANIFYENKPTNNNVL